MTFSCYFRHFPIDIAGALCYHRVTGNVTDIVSSKHAIKQPEEAQRLKICTIRDIAHLAGVSVTTVSRVLNHRPDVSPKTREKVEQVMAANHFVGNANARGLKQPASETVALILRGRQNPFLNALAEAMLQYARDFAPAFLTEFIDEKADEFQAATQLWHEKRVSGFIFLGSRIDDRAKMLEGLDVPMVFATANAEGAPLARAGSVFTNERQMGHDAMQLLLDAGHRKIAVFGGNRFGTDGFARRYAGAMQALADVDVPFDDERYIECRFSLKDAYDTTRAFFATHPDTTAVFCMSDTVAMGVIRALADIGRRVPEDVGVIGFDGIEMGKYFIPRLTTVEQPIAEIARESVHLLMEMLESDAPPRHIAVPAKLLIRESARTSA